MADVPTVCTVQVIYSPEPRRTWIREVDLTAPESARRVLTRSGLFLEFPELQTATWTLGVWGRKIQPGQIIKAGDRLEFYRPLQVDPKLARRERFKKQGAKTAGLFTQHRVGAKAGY